MLASCSATASAKGFSPQSDPNLSVIHASWIFVAALPAGLLSSFQTSCQLRPASVVLATPSHLIPPSSRSPYEISAVLGSRNLVAIARLSPPPSPKLPSRQVAPSASLTTAD